MRIKKFFTCGFTGLEANEKKKIFFYNRSLTATAMAR
jgi:hypothetical protein